MPSHRASSCKLLAAVLLCAGILVAQSYNLTTVAGTSWVVNGRDATAASLRNIAAVAQDKDGNVYAALPIDHRVIRIGTDGKTTVVAGNGEPGASGDGGQAALAMLDWPFAIVLDAKGGLLIADHFADVVRRVDLATGIISTVAGRPYQRDPLGDGGPATEASVDPRGLAVDAAGNIYVADFSHSRIRKISAATGIITTFAGNGSTDSSGDGKPATEAGTSCPFDLALDSQGSLYYYAPCWGSGHLRKIDGKTGTITTLAGIGIEPLTLVDGPLQRNTLLFLNTHLASAADGTVLLISGNYVARITAEGQLQVLGGAREAGFAGDGGAPKSAKFNRPLALAGGPNGDILIADSGNYRIRRIRGSVVTTIAGRDPLPSNRALEAMLDRPSDVLATGDGFLLADYGLGRIRKVTGSQLTDFSDALGNATSIAQLNDSGPLYIASETDSRPQQTFPSFARISRRLANGTIENAVGIFGRPFVAGDGGPALNARLFRPRDLAFDPDGNLYIADDATIRVVDRANTIQRLAGNGAINAQTDDAPALQTGMIPRQVARDAEGNILFADSYNHAVRKLDRTTNRVTTVAGQLGQPGFSGDGGPPRSAHLNTPIGLAIDSAGAIYVGDYGNARIRVIRGNVINTIAGSGRIEFDGETGPALCLSIRPVALSVAANNSIYAADGHDRIRRLDRLGGDPPACPQRAPLITSVRSIGDFGGIEQIASGTWIEIKGHDLAQATRPWVSTDFQGADAPTSLSGSSVRINGKQAFVSYVSRDQINAQVPADPFVGRVAVTVTTAIGTSAPVFVSKQNRAPGLLAFPRSLLPDGTKLLVAQLSDGAYVGPEGFVPGAAMRPGRAGDSVTFFGIGFGDGTPVVPPGQISLTPTALPNFSVRINGFPAEVLYAGLAPGVIGLYQFNVKLPDMTISGTFIARVTISVGGVNVPQQLAILFSGR